MASVFFAQPFVAFFFSDQVVGWGQGCGFGRSAQDIAGLGLLEDDGFKLFVDIRVLAEGEIEKREAKQRDENGKSDHHCAVAMNECRSRDLGFSANGLAKEENVLLGTPGHVYKQLWHTIVL